MYQFARSEVVCIQLMAIISYVRELAMSLRRSLLQVVIQRRLAQVPFNDIDRLGQGLQ
jgi:hypothetical protein